MYVIRCILVQFSTEQLYKLYFNITLYVLNKCFSSSINVVSMSICVLMCLRKKKYTNYYK